MVFNRFLPSVSSGHSLFSHSIKRPLSRKGVLPQNRRIYQSKRRANKSKQLLTNICRQIDLALKLSVKYLSAYEKCCDPSENCLSGHTVSHSKIKVSSLMERRTAELTLSTSQDLAKSACSFSTRLHPTLLTTNTKDKKADTRMLSSSILILHVPLIKNVLVLLTRISLIY